MGMKASLNEGLVGYWPIIGTAQPQNDYSGKGNNLTSVPVNFVTGKFNAAYRFMNSSDYAYNAAIPNIDLMINDNVSISCWTYLANVTMDTFIVNAGSNIYLNYDQGSSQLRFFIGSGIYTYSTEFTIGSWQYITGTYDGRTIRLYIDGKLVGETPTQIQLSNPSYIYFHGTSGNDLYLDEVRIYDRALS
jgi:hypothetical protein